MILYKNFMVLPIAFVIVLILSFNVLAQDKTDKKLDCKPLPEGNRIKVLGFELGTCKSQMEKILKKHPNIKSDWTSAVEKLRRNQDSSRISYIVTQHTSLVPPYKNLLSKPILIELVYFDDKLYQIIASISYKKTIPKNQNLDIYKAFLNNLKDKYINQEGAYVNTISGDDFNTLIIAVNGMSINLHTFSVNPYIYSLSYSLIELMEPLQKYESEVKKSKEKMEDF